ncbi:hypothetical protein M0654_21845 [Rhizobium sp. NTR19]|uniref:Uncharacterized protein n=1 Tax=Neorhizobium turbinariae TaxID=2937795 RepID=A0ABT0IXN2_9HYPH|nr:hypothetical protein [Neorhizobium turbinariae]MCK8782615.1 hypothetical protein [Neorhizobium turbinariae]
MQINNEVLQLTEEDERAFDITLFNHPIGRNGLIFMGIPYFDERLQQFINKNKKGRADIRVNPWDLGKIKARTLDGMGFYSLTCPIPGFDGVSVTHWRIAQQWLTERFSLDEQKDHANVMRALKATMYKVEVAEERNDIASHQHTADDLLRIHRSIKGHLYQPKAQQDYGDTVPEEPSTTEPEESPPVSPRSRKDILGPSANAPSDPDRFEKARKEAGLQAVSPQVTRPKAAAPKRSQHTDVSDGGQQRSSGARRKRLFNPDYKSEDK